MSEAFQCVGLDWRKYVSTDPSLYRPTEISEGRGNSAKAGRILEWKSRYNMQDVVKNMVEHELTNTRREVT